MISRIKKHSVREIIFHINNKYVSEVYKIIFGLPLFLMLIIFLYLYEFNFREKIKVGLIPQRLGHQAANLDLFLRRIDLNIYPKEIKYYFIINPYQIANEQLLKMFERKLAIKRSWLLSKVIKWSEWLLLKTRFYQDLPMDSNEFNEYQKTDVKLIFTDEERQLGIKILRDMGVNYPDDWFVCIFARDKAYLKKAFPGMSWGYHDYRNADIETYNKAIKYIVDKGGFVIRLGSVVENKLKYKHERLIDYPYSEYRSDFMDTFLSAHCKYYLGSLSGCAEIVKIFDIPIAGVNLVPIAHAPWGKNSIYIPKKLKDNNSNTYISLKDGLVKKIDTIFDGIKLKEIGYEYEDNSEDEIYDLNREMYNFLFDANLMSIEEKNMLSSYYMIHMKSSRFGKVKTPIGKYFLTKYKHIYADV